MSRAALLPVGGSPFALAFCFHFFERYWQDEVDTLYVHYNSPVEKEVVDFCRELVTRSEKAVFKYTNETLDQGGALESIFGTVAEDYLLFVEDDAPILQVGVVDKYFKLEEFRYLAGLEIVNETTPTTWKDKLI